VHQNRSSEIRRRQGVAFAAAFAGAFVIGGALIAAASWELCRTPVEMAKPDPSVLEERRVLDERFRQARQRTAVARRQADDAAVAVFEFLNRTFEDVVERSHRPSAADARRGPTMRPNPEWVALNGQLTAIERQRGEFLEKMTPAHPRVQAADREIANVQAQLAAVPAQLPAASGDASKAPTGQPSIEAESGASQVGPGASNAAAPSAEDQQHYRNLLLAAGQARDAYRAAVDIENAASNELRRDGAPQIAMDRPGTIPLPPGQSEGQMPFRDDHPSADMSFPIGAIAILTLLSCLGGLFAAARIERPNLTFMSTEEIEATLGLPVLGRFGSQFDLRREDAA